MATKWTQINESMLSSRENTDIFESDMTELEASMAISEAISFSAEAKYMAKGIVDDVCSLNEKAEANDYSVSEYIEESFMVGGIIVAIIGLLILAFKALANAGKAVVKGSSTMSTIIKGGSSKGGVSLDERFHNLYNRSIPYVNFKSKLPDKDVLYYLISIQPVSAVIDSDVYGKDNSISHVMNKSASILWNPDDITEKNCKDVLNTVKPISEKTRDGLELLKNLMVASPGGKPTQYARIMRREYNLSVDKYSELDISNFKGSISSYLGKIQKHIDVGVEDFDRDKLDKILKALGDTDLSAILDVNITTTSESIKSYESYIVQLERAKNGLKAGKDKYATLNDEGMVDIMNSINSCLLAINSAVTDYQTNFSIPGFTLMKLGCQHLIKFADDCEKAFKDADAASKNPGKDKTHEDIQKDAEEFMKDMKDPKSKKKIIF